MKPVEYIKVNRTKSGDYEAILDSLDSFAHMPCYWYYLRPYVKRINHVESISDGDKWKEAYNIIMNCGEKLTVLATGKLSR